MSQLCVITVIGITWPWEMVDVNPDLPKSVDFEIVIHDNDDVDELVGDYLTDKFGTPPNTFKYTVMAV